MADKLNISDQTLYAGTSWSWTESTPLYPAPEYSLSVLLKLGANAVIKIDSTPEGDIHRIAKPKSETAILPGGDYAYQVLALNDTSASIIESGIIHIYPVLTQESLDPRGYYVQLLEKLRAAYLLAAERGWADIEVNGRTIRYSRETLVKELENAEYKARLELRKAQGKKTGKILTRFK